MCVGSSPVTSEITSASTRRARGGGEPPALDRRQVLAHRVHVLDRRAAREQLARDRLEVGHRDALGRAARAGSSRRRRRARAAGRPARGRAASARISCAAASPRLVGHRMAGLDHADAPRRQPVAVARDDEPLERRAGGPVLLDRRAMDAAALPGAHDERAARAAAAAGAPARSRGDRPPRAAAWKLPSEELAAGSSGRGLPPSPPARAPARGSAR